MPGGSGIELLVGEEVLLLCQKYAYAGHLTAISPDGKWATVDGIRWVLVADEFVKDKWTEKRLELEKFYVQISWIECCGKRYPL